MEVIRRLLRPLAAWLATVTAVDVGRPNDGLDRLLGSGTAVDKSWRELYEEIEDAREAWRKNPMARRVINLITSYVVGQGMTATSEYGPLRRFIDLFWHHPQNNMALLLDDLCDELARSGELFLVLFTNEFDGMSYVRAIPASQIEQVEWQDGDYKTELRYKETSDPGADDKWWYAPAGAPDDWSGPIMLHYAVNRAIGAVRGESDLAPILPWLKRYNRFLEDRVRLNASVRAFLWIVKAPARLLADLREKYRVPPEAGTVIVADQNEEWAAVTPSLNARDAAADGRAIRWMIAAGGPGTALTDFGEGEDANLATATATGELRRRFLVQRQAYFSFMLADLIVHAYNRWVSSGKRSRAITVADVIISKPDIAADDNSVLAGAVLSLVGALSQLHGLLGDSDAFKRFSLRLFVKFVGESITEKEFEALMQGKAIAEDLPADDEESDEAGGLHVSKWEHLNGYHSKW